MKFLQNILTNISCLLTLTIFFLITPLTSFARSAAETCGTLSSGAGQYCIHPSETGGNNDIVLHLHGKGGSEKTWGESYFYTSQIRTYWKQQGLKTPTVITLSYGPVWLLAQKNAQAAGGLLDLVIARDLPELEGLIGGVKGRRIVMGESMGGFNATQLALKTKLFDKAVILCAPMAEGISPFSEKSRIDQFIQDSVALKYYTDAGEPELVAKSVSELSFVVKLFFDTEADWQKADPLILARQEVIRADMPIYVAAGFYDRYAAYEGNERFSQILQERGFNLEWRAQWGGHCAMDIPSLAQFLVK